jgi:hypothetical protein
MVFTPMQGAFAAVMKSDYSHNSHLSSQMDMKQDNMASQSDCHSHQKCDKSCCDNQCSSMHCKTHCASNFVVLVSDSISLADAEKVIERFSLTHQVTSNYPDLLFRPPRAYLPID